MAAPFALRGYQVETLRRLREFLEKTVEFKAADFAFFFMTRRNWISLPALPGLPYVCLRVPTGGGKTILAAHSVGVAADSFLRTDAPTVLWLVPSQTIREQTLAGLLDRSHPNRRALADRFGENVRVMSVSEALYAKRADYDGGAVVIVTTIQAFRVEETEGRKVYEPNGELMDHFTGLAAELRRELEIGPAGDPVPSLVNVLRLRRPMVIVDEAHNARTSLSFDMLARLRPALIVEFTATPVTPEEHKPDRGIYASNVLHHVSAAELKAADMIKLPVILRGRPAPRETIQDAIACLDALDTTARAEAAETGEYIRPVMLLQAEVKSKDRPTQHAAEVKRMLIEDFRVTADHVAVATGETREIDEVDLFDKACTIRFIITQSALREGWDCSFAYVLCSVAEQKSPRSVEQLLGRVLRLPYATRKRREELNRAYAFATTSSFQQAASTLRDGLVNNGFERIEAEALVRLAPGLPGFEPGGEAYEVEGLLPEGVDAAAFKVEVEAATSGRVVIDLASGKLRTRGAMTIYDHKTLLLAMPAAAPAIDALFHRSRGARLRAAEETEAPMRFAVPWLAVRRGEQLELFDRTHFLDIPWKLEECDPAPILTAFSPPKAAGDEARLDVDTTGRVTVDFVTNLHEQLTLALPERGWTKPALINWLDRHLPNSSRRDITKVSSTLFIARALDLIAVERSVALGELARGRFRLVEALVQVIKDHREDRERVAFGRALIPQSGLEFEASAALELVFEERSYAYQQPYTGGTVLSKHFFPIIGDLEPAGEEHACAVYIDRLSEVKAWVRNTSRQKGSFWLQTASDKFYPDFVALLNDGRVVVIEYKRERDVSNDDSREKRLVGDLWAERSGGRCLFQMVSKGELGQLDAAIRRR